MNAGGAARASSESSAVSPGRGGDSRTSSSWRTCCQNSSSPPRRARSRGRRTGWRVSARRPRRARTRSRFRSGNCSGTRSRRACSCRASGPSSCLGGGGGPASSSVPRSSTRPPSPRCPARRWRCPPAAASGPARWICYGSREAGTPRGSHPPARTRWSYRKETPYSNALRRGRRNAAGRRTTLRRPRPVARARVSPWAADSGIGTSAVPSCPAAYTRYFQEGYGSNRPEVEATRARRTSLLRGRAGASGRDERAVFVSSRAPHSSGYRACFAATADTAPRLAHLPSDEKTPRGRRGFLFRRDRARREGARAPCPARTSS